MLVIAMRLFGLLRRRWLIWAILGLCVLITLNILGMYILKTGVDPYNPIQTWILRDVRQLWPWE